MFSFIFPEVSPTGGDTGDGVILGSVNESLLTAAYHTKEKCPGAVIYRMDRANGSLNIINDTTAALSTTPNAFYPFGSATFSDGDEFIVACDEEIQGILINIDTIGVHAALLKVYDSTDGIWATNLLTVTDGTNAFESSGWRQIVIPDNASRVAWRPSSDPSLNIPSKKYIRFRLDGVVGGNTPPGCSNLVPIRDVFRYENHTANLNGDTATAPTADTHYPWAGSVWAWGFGNPAYGAEVYMHLTSTNAITDVHEYLASDGTWKSLTGWSNDTGDFTNGPTVLGSPVQKFPIRWDIPADWALMPQTLTLDDGTTETTSAYWIRERTTGVTAYGPFQPARYRVRARQFGNANTGGIAMIQPATVRGMVLVGATVVNTSACNCQVVNMTTGKSAVATIPASPAMPMNLDTADLEFVAGDKLGLVCNSGGTIKNAQVAFID